MTPPLPPLTAHAFATPAERRAFAAGVLYGMQGAAEVLEDLAADELGAGHPDAAQAMKEAAEGLRGAVDDKAAG